jgi:hypothetical protein
MMHSHFPIQSPLCCCRRLHERLYYHVGCQTTTTAFPKHDKCLLLSTTALQQTSIPMEQQHKKNLTTNAEVYGELEEDEVLDDQILFDMGYMKKAIELAQSE